MTATDRALRCPSCDGPMQAVERRGAFIDICRDCKGVYLDRGELDKLLDEAAKQDAVAPTDPAAVPAPSALADEAERLRARRGRDHRDHRDDDDDGDHGWERGRGRRRGWLDDIFDFD